MQRHNFSLEVESNKEQESAPITHEQWIEFFEGSNKSTSLITSNPSDPSESITSTISAPLFNSKETSQAQTQTSQLKKFIQIDFSYFKTWQSNSSYLVKFRLTNLLLTFELKGFSQYICEFDQHPSIVALPTSNDKSHVFGSVMTKLTAALNKKIRNHIQIKGHHVILNRATVNEINTQLPGLLKFYDVLPVQIPQPAEQTKVLTPSGQKWQEFIKKRKLPEQSFDESTSSTMTTQTTLGFSSAESKTRSSSEESQNNDLQESVIQQLNKRSKK